MDRYTRSRMRHVSVQRLLASLWPEYRTALGSLGVTRAYSFHMFSRASAMSFDALRSLKKCASPLHAVRLSSMDSGLEEFVVRAGSVRILWMSRVACASCHGSCSTHVLLGSFCLLNF